jgi:hypothetical protein
MANQVKVERRGSYQGVPQYGITGCSEITPSRATAMKWARWAIAEQQLLARLKSLPEHSEPKYD